MASDTQWSTILERFGGGRTAGALYQKGKPDAISTPH